MKNIKRKKKDKKRVKKYQKNLIFFKKNKLKKIKSINHYTNHQIKMIINFKIYLE